MPLNIWKTREQAFALAVENIRSQLPNSDPTLKGSIVKGCTESFTSLFMTNQGQIQDVLKQAFPQTADSEFLEAWGGYENLPRNPAVGSRGSISQPGVAGTVISIGTLVTAVCESSHGIGSSQEITISGADQSDYNGAHDVTVISATSFTFEVTGSPVSPATGTITWNADFATVLVQCKSTGIDTNLESGATLTTQDLSAAIVTFDGLSGGADTEDDTLYLARILLSRSIIEGVFNNPQVELAALSISGNTRIFIKNPTIEGYGNFLDPIPGQVSIFFLRDDDPNIIPNATIIAETKAAILQSGALPAHTSAYDVFVQAPILKQTDFVFSNITPDTITMRSAVESQLNAFFEDSVTFEQTVTEASYLGAIYQTQDLSTGSFISSFSLSSPQGDIVMTDGNLAALGGVSYAVS